MDSIKFIEQRDYQDCSPGIKQDVLDVLWEVEFLLQFMNQL